MCIIWLGLQPSNDSLLTIEFILCNDVDIQEALIFTNIFWCSAVSIHEALILPLPSCSM